MEKWPVASDSDSEKRKGIFESLYKSRTARVLALAVTLFGAGASMQRSLEEHEDEKVVAVEILEEEGFRLNELAGKFRIDIQVGGGEKTILHIGQSHTPEGDAIKPEAAQEIIESQKNIEELLGYMEEKGITDTVYVEGFTERYRERLDDIKNLVAHNVEVFPDNVVADATIIMSYALRVQEVRPGNNAERASKAGWLYSAKCELERQTKKLRAEYEKYQSTGHADGRYQKTFEGWKQNGVTIEEVIGNITSVAQEIGADELIKGDNVYLWGAAQKMYAEGRIDIRPVETDEAREKTMAPYSFVEGIASMPYGGYKPAYRSRIREDVAIDIIQTENPSEKVIPLIFGEMHDFTESVLAHNETDSGKFNLAKAVGAGTEE